MIDTSCREDTKMRICLLTTQDLDADPFPDNDWPCDPRPFMPEAEWHVATLVGKVASVAQVEKLIEEGFFRMSITRKME